MSIKKVVEDFRNVGIKVVVALPDSGLAMLCKQINFSTDIKYIQTTHESDCVGIATGLAVCGIRSIVLMENSGLRNACETIARFHLSHHLFTSYLITHRGSFGERNWWGQAHHETMLPLLKLLRFRWHYMHAVKELQGSLDLAYSTLDAGQSSVALIAAPSFFSELSI